MKLIILGDIHGQWYGANATVQSALKDHPDAHMVVSVGDLGDGWPTKNGFNRWTPNFDLPILVVDGNHENFDAIEAGNTNPRLEWMYRGRVVTFNSPNSNYLAMFFGGATSPDLDGRVIGKTWWPQESITRRQMQLALRYNGPELTAMFCHERAECFPIPEEWNLIPMPGSPGRSDRVALEAVVRKHRPRFYFHGHWHHPHYKNYNLRIKGQMDIDRYVKVVSCPVITKTENYWTVFDGTHIWRNW